MFVCSNRHFALLHPPPNAPCLALNISPNWRIAPLTLPTFENYVCRSLVLEYVSKSHTSNITFSLGFKIEYFYCVGQPWWLLKLMAQMYNYITSKLRQKCVWELCLQLRHVKKYVSDCFRVCNEMIYVASVLRLKFVVWIFPWTSRPLRQDAWGITKSFLTTGAATKHFLLHERPQVFGADIHNQEVSEYGFVYGSKLWKFQFSVDSQLRTQLTKQPPRSSSKGNFFVRVRLRRLSEYGYVACFVERPTWETQA